MKKKVNMFISQIKMNSSRMKWNYYHITTMSIIVRIARFKIISSYICTTFRKKTVWREYAFPADDVNHTWSNLFCWYRIGMGEGLIMTANDTLVTLTLIRSADGNCEWPCRRTNYKHTPIRVSLQFWPVPVPCDMGFAARPSVTPLC